MTQLEVSQVGAKSERISPSAFFAMFAGAILLRLLLLICTSIVFHKTFHSMAQIGDGASYIAYAKTIAGQRGILSDYDRRVFPGYPLLIAAVHLPGVPWDIAAVGTSWIAAGLASVLATILTRSRWVGWGMVCLTPHYLLYTSVSMTEAVLLAFGLAGLVLAMKGIDRELPASDKRRWILPIIGGLLLGFAGVVRPFACFAVAGFLLHAARQRQWRAAILVAIAALAVVGGGALGLYLATGDALQGVKAYRDNPGAYHGELYTYPFKSLISHSLHGHVPIAKLVYVWAYVIVNITAVVLLTRRLIKTWNKLDQIDLLWMWLVGNTIAILCIGSLWGFEAFHRFSSWALPAELFALLPFLPRRIWSWSVVTAISFAVALYSINRN